MKIEVKTWLFDIVKAIEEINSFFPENNNEQLWVTKGEVIKFPGFMKLYTEGTDDEGDEENPTLNLPDLKK